MISVSAFISSASFAEAKSLSITAGVPTSLPDLLITGIPPPPTVMITLPASTKVFTISFSITSTGFGLGTT